MERTTGLTASGAVGDAGAVARIVVLLVGALALGSCEEAATPTPAQQPAAVTKSSGFQFEATLNTHRPKGSVLELVAEVGDAATGRLSLVVAHHDGSELALAAWLFSSTGEDETLVPIGATTALLALRPGETTDEETLDALVRTRAAGHSVGGRRQGIDAPDAAAALRSLHEHATLTLNPDATPAARTEALASFTRGLDDALLFSRKGLSGALATLATLATPSAPKGSSRRASVTWGTTTVSMLRKADGWTIDALR
ncbi:MAG: hypothetical protein KUG77_16620 [Nannocystaceae bacterium]|nr:hypothetical protein [Nannocystaceae bacterium]